MIEHDKVDVVIVGSGAAGSVYGAILAEGGKGVLVLEKGPARKLGDLYSSQIWARRLKWGAPHVIEEGKNSIWFNFNAGHGFGGASIHHYGVWPRYHPEDFKEKSLFGKSLDWPFDYDVLRPYYDQVQLDVGISGDAELE
ncbi:MAG TPA: GMC family oxidoreductase, partial [Sphingomonadales bacterium]|nr:GMC family oxidoreductase [Sphingomonadales bacterium]